MDRGRFCGLKSAGDTGGGALTMTTSPSLTRCAGRAAAPLTLISPPAASACNRLRDRPAAASRGCPASQASRRAGRGSAPATNS